MKILFTKPYLLFIVSIPVIILIGLRSGDATISFNISETYYVFAISQVTILISIMFAVIGVGYWFMHKTKRNLSNRLSKLHFGATFGGALLIIILTQLYQDGVMDYKFNEYLTLIIYLVVLVMIIAQIIFPINLLKSLRKD